MADTFGCALLTGGATCWGSPPRVSDEAGGPRDVPLARALDGAVELSPFGAGLCARYPDGAVRCADPHRDAAPFADPSIGPVRRLSPLCALTADDALWCVPDDGEPARRVASVPDAIDLAGPCVLRAGGEAACYSPRTGEALHTWRWVGATRLVILAPYVCGVFDDRPPACLLPMAPSPVEVPARIAGVAPGTLFAWSPDGTVLEASVTRRGIAFAPHPALSGARELASNGAQLCALLAEDAGLADDAADNSASADDAMPADAMPSDAMPADADLAGAGRADADLAGAGRADADPAGERVVCETLGGAPARVRELAPAGSSVTGLAAMGETTCLVTRRGLERCVTAGTHLSLTDTDLPSAGRTGCSRLRAMRTRDGFDARALLCADGLRRRNQDGSYDTVADVVQAAGAQADVLRYANGDVRVPVGAAHATDDVERRLGARVADLAPAVDVSGGGAACAALRDGRVRCRAGAATYDLPGVTDAVQVVAASTELCVRTEAGRVRCLHHSARFWPSRRARAAAPPRPLDLAGEALRDTGLDAVTSLVGAASVCALTSAGEVHCWGDNPEGVAARVEAPSASTGLLAPLPDHGRRARRLDWLADVTHLTVAPTYACARQSTGRVLCWGAVVEDESAADVRAALTVPSSVARVAP